MAFAAFSAVASAVLFSVLLKTGLTSQPEGEAPLSSVQRTADLLVLYREGETAFACELSLNFTAKTAESTLTDTPKVPTAEGDFAFAERCRTLTANKPEYFVVLSQESFVKIADKSHGLVYNNGNESFLLTGLQAAELLSEERFAEFCEKIANSALESNLESYFRLLTQATVNNLSFPELYNTVYR